MNPTIDAKQLIIERQINVFERWLGLQFPRDARHVTDAMVINDMERGASHHHAYQHPKDIRRA